MKRKILTLAAILSLGMTGSAMAQRGGGGGGGHGGGGHGGGGHGGGGHGGGHGPVLCKTGPLVKAKARQLQQASFDLRDAVSSLPRPGKWWPVAKPVGKATRTILKDLNGPQRRGICLKLNKGVRDVKIAVRQFNRKLNREGRGRYNVLIQQKLKKVTRKLNQFERAKERRRGPRW